MKKILDHGYLKLVETWGSDRSIVEAARMSTDRGFLGWGGVDPCENCDGEGLLRNPANSGETQTCRVCGGTKKVNGDEKLLRYLYTNTPPHTSPFEFGGLIIEVQAPIFVFREWHRHRTQCLAGDTMLHFESPKSEKSGRRYVYKMPIAEAWRKFQPSVRASRPERQENALWSQSRIASMRLRCCNEETKEVVYTRIANIVRGEEKRLLRVTTIGGKTIRASADHRFFTDQGWQRLEDAVANGALLAVERTVREMAQSWETPPVNETLERWRDVVGWEGLYEISDQGRCRRVGHSPKRGTIGSHGYPITNLNRPGIQQTRTIHTLVLEAWKGPRGCNAEARHLNSNRIDARSINLEWGSVKENANDRLVSDRQTRLTIGFEEIASCEPAGVEMTYDLAVEDPWHNFVADGFVVHNSYNEMSARYTPLPDLNYVPSIERVMINASTTNKQAGTIAGSAGLTLEAAEAFRLELANEYHRQQDFYERALAAGVPKELARVDLPVGRYSRMRASANLLNWLKFLTLRMDRNAQWEIRQYAIAISELVAEAFPRTWELFVEGRSSS